MKNVACLLTLGLLLVGAPLTSHGQSLPNDDFYLPAHAEVDGPVIAPNDNRLPLGVQRDGSVVAHLTVTRGHLLPEDDRQPGLWVEAVAAEGQAPTIPAPLLRVTTGRMLSLTLTNALPDSSVTWFGFQARPIAAADSIVLAPGETRSISFDAGEPGTYLYRAQIGSYEPDGRAWERDLTSGAFIVDPEGDRPDDRVFVMNIWSQADSTLPDGGYNTLLINGKSWPHTERLVADVGVAERWHVVNASGRNHPMHLHGFFFDVIRRGGLALSTTYAEADRSHVVTETLRGYRTMELEWIPAREGEWLFHCHLSFHVSSANRLPGSDHGHGHMAGLVMGISVRPGASDLIERGEPRHLTLTLSEMPDSNRFVFDLQDDSGVTEAIRTERGPLLNLIQYQPTYVTVVNRSSSPTGIHWHGLELDAWADGVPGFSASGGKVSPTIPPDSSFTYKLTLMKTGTFMYHTHLDDIGQLARGLYGPIVVSSREEPRDTDVDHTYILGWRQPNPDGPQQLEVNGIAMTQPQPQIATQTGTTHRLRLMNMAAAGNITMQMLRNDEPVSLAVIAKDGADLPAHMRQVVDSLPRLFVGEIIDAEFSPSEPGTYELRVGYGGPAMAVQTWVVEE